MGGDLSGSVEGEALAALALRDEPAATDQGAPISVAGAQALKD